MDRLGSIMPRRGGARPGQALVIAALAMTVLLFMVALAVDVGNLILQRRQLIKFAELAALTGAQVYDDSAGAIPLVHPTGVGDAEANLRLNGVLCPGPDCTVTRLAATPAIGCPVPKKKPKCKKKRKKGKAAAAAKKKKCKRKRKKKQK